MSNELYAIDKSTLDGIADSVREIKSSTGHISVPQLESEIRGIATFHIDGEKVLKSTNFETDRFNVFNSILPFEFLGGSVGVVSGELHIMSNGTDRSHYKWNGESWSVVSTGVFAAWGMCNAVTIDDVMYVNCGSHLTKWTASESYCGQIDTPQSCTHMVVCGGEIHILGGSDADLEESSNHYKWNGSSWELVSTMPVRLGVSDCSVVLNNEIYILSYNGLSGSDSLLKWDGSEWIQVGTLPYSFTGGAAVVFDGEIHIFGGRFSPSTHYKWDGNAWIALSNIPFDLVYGHAIVFGHEMHILGSETGHGAWMHVSSEAARYREV